MSSSTAHVSFKSKHQVCRYNSNVQQIAKNNLNLDQSTNDVLRDEVQQITPLFCERKKVFFGHTKNPYRIDVSLRTLRDPTSNRQLQLICKHNFNSPTMLKTSEHRERGRTITSAPLSILRQKPTVQNMWIVFGTADDVRRSFWDKRLKTVKRGVRSPGNAHSRGSKRQSRRRKCVV